MKEVHNQLCVAKRQRLAAESKGAALQQPQQQQQQKPAAPSQSTPQLEQPTAQRVPAAAATISGGSGSGSGSTTISLTGSGTNYSKMEGPIDPS
ncbi:MAG TPA: hypothetical protein VJ551_04360, partial [Nitrososphaeraceae archaeon]|nr:hypothetical protein [Nitrososphaeraceae archaeon]